MSATSLPARALSEVVDEIYAGTLDSLVWDRALLQVADLVRASGTLLFAFNPQTGAVLRDENHRIDPQLLVDYARYWTFQDQRLEHFMASPAGVPVTERTLKIADFRRSPILNEFLIPADAPYFMPAWLSKSADKVVAISLQGTRRRGPFDGCDLATLGRLVPHLKRALEIRDRLAAAQIRADTLASSLDGMSLGILVLDDRGRLLEANALAQEHLRAGEGIASKSDGTLQLREPTAAGQLAGWLSTGRPPDQSPDGLLRIPRQGAEPLSLLLTRLPRTGTSWMRADPRWMLVIFDPTRQIQASLELVALDLGVTPREAEVATLLFSGLTLVQIAHRMGVSVHTVRSQVKSIFRKTGTQSQADLVRRIALGPALGCAPRPSGRVKV
jgi:DNA-binding CsgD family transcriptional regulator/PAS domain-containing protein